MEYVAALRSMADMGVGVPATVCVMFKAASIVAAESAGLMDVILNTPLLILAL